VEQALKDARLEVFKRTPQVNGCSDNDIHRLGNLLAQGKTWAQAKAALPHITDAALEANKAAAEAWAADYPQFRSGR